MPTLTITSLRGGLNNSDPPISLADDQVTVATNVEFLRSTCGERRRGADAIDISGSADLTGCDSLLWCFRHLPTADPADAQLWVAGLDGATVVLAYKDTTWHTVTVPDAFIVDGLSEYQIEAVSLHGKLFIFYKSAVDRAHVLDPDYSTSALRRVGMAELSTAPTAALSGSGSLDTTRYYRVRETVQIGVTTVLRSEPSDVLTRTVTGSPATITVTKPSTVNTDPAATHWELEASLDAANFYVIATTAIGTTTATDSTAAATGYTGFGEVSAIAGAYTPPHSAKYGIADDDRMVLFSAWEDDALASSVSWTPPSNATGVGNDERIPVDPAGDGSGISTLSLDNFNGGVITDVSSPVAGEVWVFKQTHIYKLTRTRQIARAYDATTMSHTRGAIRWSVCECVDPAGNPAIFFADTALGPHLISSAGIQQCAQDIWGTWKDVYVNPSLPYGYRTLYYPTANQVQMSIIRVVSRTGDTIVANTTDRIVLQLNELRLTATGWRRGWAFWTQTTGYPNALCLFSDNIDEDSDRNLFLKPFMAMGGLGSPAIWMQDTGDDDNGTEYTAEITTKPYALDLQTAMEIKSATFIAKAVEDAQIVPSIIPDFGITTTKVADTVDFSPAGSETHVTRRVDDLGLADCTVAQVDIADTATPGTRWELARIALTVERGQGN